MTAAQGRLEDFGGLGHLEEMVPLCNTIGYTQSACITLITLFGKKLFHYCHIKGVFTLIHLNVHWTKSHQSALIQFAFTPFTLWLPKANSIMDYEKYIVKAVDNMKVYLEIYAI